MPRPQRIALAGAYYHVSHGVAAAGPALFRDHDDMVHFFSLLEKVASSYGVVIYAYCVLPRRYHVLCQTQQANVHQVMRYLNHAYAQWLQRPGAPQRPRFDGRYQAYVIDQKRYLAAVSVVIHREALGVAGEQWYQQYRWSSMRAYLGKATAPAWLQMAAVMQQLRDQHQQGCYASHEQCQLPATVQHFYGLKRRPPVLGDAAFVQQLKAKPSQVSRQGPQMAVRMPSHVGMADVVRCTADYFHVPVASVMTAKRGKLNVPRNVAIHLSRSLVHATTVQIAAYFGLRTHSAVSNVMVAMRERLQCDAGLMDACSRIETQLSTTMVSLVDGAMFDVF